MHSNYRHYLSASTGKSRQPTKGDGSAGCSGANVACNPAYMNGLPAPIASRCSNLSGGSSSSNNNHTSRQVDVQPPPASYYRAEFCGSEQVQQSHRITAGRAQSIDYWQQQQLHQSGGQSVQNGGKMRELYTLDHQERTQLTGNYKLEQHQQQANPFARMTQQLNPEQLVKQLNELKQQPTPRRSEQEFCSPNRQPSVQNRDHYASQIRSNQIQHRFQPIDQQYPQQQPQQQYQPQPQSQPRQQQAQIQARCSVVGSSSAAPEQSSSSADSGNGGATGSSRSKSLSEREVRVNFNRHSQANQDDDDEGDSRKKKYLTAKYGQQQMNLIKKRLKIEMWLYEQLQELAKGSKSEAEMDEIDIDLDQLLDLDDDDIRRRWLKKTLGRLEDLPAERIDQFIDQVLEQSKLL